MTNTIRFQMRKFKNGSINSFMPRISPKRTRKYSEIGFPRKSHATKRKKNSALSPLKSKFSDKNIKTCMILWKLHCVLNAKINSLVILMRERSNDKNSILIIPVAAQV